MCEFAPTPIGVGEAGPEGRRNTSEGVGNDVGACPGSKRSKPLQFARVTPKMASRRGGLVNLHHFNMKRAWAAVEVVYRTSKCLEDGT